MTGADSTKTAVRFRSLDFMRGFLVFAVVFAHLLFLSGTSDGDGGEISIALQILYLGLMGFFVVSGCLYVRGTGFTPRMKKRVVSLAVAIIVCTLVLPVVLFVYLAVIGQPADVSQFQYAYRPLLGELAVFMPCGEYPLTPTFCVHTAYYYLWIMVFAFVIFYHIADKVLESTRNTVLAVAVLVLITAVIRQVCDINLPYNLTLIPIAVALMIFGAVIRNSGMLERIESVAADRTYWGVFLVSLVIAVVVPFFFHPGVSFHECYFGAYGGWSAFPYFVSSSAFCTVFLYASSWLVRVPVFGKVFTSLGRHSLGIILYHILILKMLIAPFHPLTTESVFPALTMVETLVFGVAALALCMIVCVYGPVLLKMLSSKVSKD